MNFKKFLSVLLVLALTILPACQSGTTPSTDQPADNSDSSPQAAESSGKIIFWDKSEYVSEYNVLMQEITKDFTAETGIEVEYVIIPPNDIKQKIMAAIEAKKVPDLMVGDDMLCAQFYAMGQLENVSDIIGAVDFTDAAKNIAKLNGEDVLIPQAFLAPGCYWRKDLWEAKGLDAPTTWQEMLDDAKLVNDPANGIYALGMPMGASGGGDAESFMRSLILSHGGVPVDENGNVTVNSPETLAALKYAASIYLEGLAPPDAITWDDGGNNAAFLAGTVGVAFNAGSIWSALKEENPQLLEKTEIISYPAGPSGKIYTPGGSNTFAIFNNGQNIEGTKQFIKFFFDNTDRYNTMIETMGGMWQPAISGLDDTPFWNDPANKGWLENSKNVVRNFHPAPADEYANLSFSNQLCVKAVQKIVVSGTDPQVALDELEQDFIEIYKNRSA